MIKPETTLAIAKWATGEDTGLSSKNIARACLGLPALDHGFYPLDVGDLGRCLRLIRAAPEAREGVRILALKYPTWSRLNEVWDRITEIAEGEGFFEDSKERWRAFPLTASLLRRAVAGPE